MQCTELLAVAYILHTAILQIPNEKNKPKCKYGAYVYVMCINLCGVWDMDWIWIYYIFLYYILLDMDNGYGYEYGYVICYICDM